MPRILRDQALIRVKSHALGSWPGDIGSEVGNDEVLAQDRLDLLNGFGVGNEVSEDLVHGHEVENTDIAGVGVEKLKVCFLAFGLDRSFGLP